MAVYAGPEIETNGLVYQIDLSNPRSTKIVEIGADQHGFSKWIAMQGDSAVYYSAIYANTTIYQTAPDGTVTEVLTTGSDPQRGTISTSKGYLYHGSNPVHFISSTGGASQHDIVPLSLAGTVFGYFCNRSLPSSIFVYPLLENAKIEVFENCGQGAGTGIFNTPNQIINAPKQEVTTITVANTGVQMFSSDTPIVASVTQFANDRMILVPAVREGYRTRIAFDYRVDGATSGNERYITDSTYTIFATEVADGDGGDSSMFLGKEHLTDTYSLGLSIANFEITAPYPNTTIDVSYWENGAWVLGETFNLNGTETSPAYVARDGTNGFGVDATNLTGSAPGMANNATLWKFEGNNPYHLAIDDFNDDEEIVIGWNAADVTSGEIRKQRFFKEMISEKYLRSIYQVPVSYSNNNSFTTLKFNGVDEQIPVDSFFSNDGTVEIWFKPYDITRDGGLYGDGGYFRIYHINGSLAWWVREQDLGSSVTVSSNLNNGSNVWYHAVGTFESGVGAKLYLNGELVGSDNHPVTYYNSAENAAIGNYYRTDTRFFYGEMSTVKHYSRTLTEQEIKKNFEATRGRFGV